MYHGPSRMRHGPRHHPVNRHPRPQRRGFTLLELSISLVLIAVLLSILLPLLSSARVVSHREQCASNQKRIGQGWQLYLGDHDDQFPFVPIQAGWKYAGVRFSPSGSLVPDYQRPLNAYLPLKINDSNPDHCVCACPADHGITDNASGAGTGKRTAFRSFGISYRANASLLDSRLAGLELEKDRGLWRSEITASRSRLVLLGDPVWYESAESTGRNAEWHGQANAGNMLFMDLSVRFMPVRPRTMPGPILFDPIVNFSPSRAEPTTRNAERQPETVLDMRE
jgi:prepilin-type N-terminal cleavage/methylation domain-containing protein